MKPRQAIGRPSVPSASRQLGARGIRFLLLFACLGLCALGLLALGGRVNPLPKQRNQPATFADLLALDPGRLRKMSVVELNLVCAQGLCPTNEPDLKACQAILEDWAARVRSETERQQYRFARNPADFENSPGFFRMLMLCVVLTEDYGIRYDEQRRAGPAMTRADDRFFADPASVFIHGLLGPERKGTCSSLPVLYVAVGRKLGYPLKLVTTRGHLFVRWEGQGERFNVEATAHGLSRFDDDYYRHWPFEIGPDEEAAQGYLRTLTAPEELAAFLSIRGMCLRDLGRLPKASAAFAAAARLAPGCQAYAVMVHTLEAASIRQANDPQHSPKAPQVNL